MNDFNEPDSPDFGSSPSENNMPPQSPPPQNEYQQGQGGNPIYNQPPPQYGGSDAYQNPPQYGQQPYYSDPNQQNAYGQQYPAPVYVNQKSKVAAGVLGILLGAFGVHNFYLGYTGKAVAQLLISILSCFTLSAVSAVWGLVEGIMILTGSIAVDGQGIPLGS